MFATVKLSDLEFVFNTHPHGAYASGVSHTTGNAQLPEQFGTTAPASPDIVTTVRIQLRKMSASSHRELPTSSNLVEQGAPIEPLVLSSEKIGTLERNVAVSVFKAPGYGVVWPIVLIIQAADLICRGIASPNLLSKKGRTEVLSLSIRTFPIRDS